MSYGDYKTIIEQLLEKGSTTGVDNSETMLEFTRLNVKRMKRWEKTARINDDLMARVNRISSKQHWVVLSEGWCGDAAQNIPLIHKLAEQNDLVDFRILLRDKNLDLMDQYLTNGGRSIPKLIVVNAENGLELGTWGPRPKPMQDLLHDLKKQPDFSYEQFSIQSHTWYARDKTQTLQKELTALLDRILSSKPAGKKAA